MTGSPGERPPNGPPSPIDARTRPRPSRPPSATAAAAVVLTMVAVVMAGFWPWYAALGDALGDALRDALTAVTRRSGAGVGDVEGASPGTHPVVQLHGAVFTGWLLLLALQVGLVHRRRIAWHRRVGRFGVAYGALLLASGAAVTVVAPTQAVLLGRQSLDQAAAFLLLPLGDLVLFAGFFSAALYWRRKRELHARLMILAAVALIFPGAARFAGPWGPMAVAGLWLSPLALAMGRDLLERGRVSRVYGVGLAILLLAFARLWIMDAEVWLRLGRPLLRAFLPAGWEG